MPGITVLLSMVVFFGCLGVQVQGDDTGKAKPHMLSYANSYAGSMGGIYPGFYGGRMYPQGFGMGMPFGGGLGYGMGMPFGGGLGYGMGMPFGGGLGYGMNPFSMYSAGKAGKKLPKV